MKSRHLKCLAHFGDPPDGNIDVRESVYLYIYKENIVGEHLTGPQHYPGNGLVSGTRGEVSRNQEEVENNSIVIIFLPQNFTLGRIFIFLRALPGCFRNL
ncbi:hypothetical protein AVEN_130091-1 [Araneus ventricosus]|uniref:Uncharacterized protein n=1 Tax=Araneus ventricosus TaxID=182803 RepID=A0A4Y2EK49_ARAVE|nr:hypothetical protein AVEN_130091-1 [Araneus ventricosus]